MNKEVIAQIGLAAGLLHKNAGFDLRSMANLFGRGAKAVGHQATGLSRTVTPQISQVGNRTVGTLKPGWGFNAAKPIQTAAGVGAAGVGGAMAHQNLSERAFYEGKSGFNPYTWGQDAPSHEELFQRNQNRFNEMAQPLVDQQEAARGKNDMGEYNRLQEQLERGNFGGTFRFGFGQSNASRFMGNAQGAQKARQGEYNKEMAAVGPQAGDDQLLQSLRQRLSSGNLLPVQAASLQKQMEHVQKRMSQTPGTETAAATAIAQKMRGAGMRHTPYEVPGGSPSPFPMPAAGHWQLGGRPMNPGFVQGWNLNPNDHRQSPDINSVWENVLAR